MCSDTSILDLLSGVEMWKVTPSKSETTWSMLAGAPLHAVSYLAAERKAAGYGAPIDAVPEEGLNEDVLVVEKKHGGGPASLGGDGGCDSGGELLSRAVMRRTEVRCDAAGRWA